MSQLALPALPDGVTNTTPQERTAILRNIKAAWRAPKEPPPPSPVHEQHTRLLIIDAELREAISRALMAVNTTRKADGEKPLDWNTFVVYGLLKNGLAAFEAARAEYEASQRMVLSADEARAMAGRRR